MGASASTEIVQKKEEVPEEPEPWEDDEFWAGLSAKESAGGDMGQLDKGRGRKTPSTRFRKGGGYKNKKRTKKRKSKKRKSKKRQSKKRQSTKRKSRKRLKTKKRR